jgi:calcium-translocating P-type ATPase
VACPTILNALQALEADLPVSTSSAPIPEDKRPAPPVLLERLGCTRRARIPVRGLDRDPELARQLVARLERHPGVRARVNQLTSRVLVEFQEHEVELQDLLAEVSDLELPALPAEDRPTDPLDPGPLIQSATSTFGATLGLGLLAVRQLVGAQEPLPGAAGAAQAAGIIGIVRGFPVTRNGLRRLFGRHLADLLFRGAAIVSLALSGNPLGLAVSGAEGLRLLTEVMARRAAWRRLEARLENVPAAEPGSVMRLEAGERSPRAATVLEGVGSAIGRDGLPLPVTEGSTIPAGSRLAGGPFVAELQPAEPFLLEPRPAPIAPSLYEYYLRAAGWLGLGYAGLTALLTRSLSRTLAALLVNPRTAMIGKEAADTGAAARVLRAGVTVVGTRPDRVIRRPDVLLLDSARVLTDETELSTVVPLTERYETTELLAWAGAVAAAAAFPWGSAFRATESGLAMEGHFDGSVAQARIEGVEYRLGWAEDEEALPAVARLRQRGDTVLVLHREQEEQPLGLFGLRPRLVPGVTGFVEQCRHRGVELGLFSGEDPVAAQAVARRAGIPLLREERVAAIRVRQQAGKIVAFVADSGEAGAALAACDLAIGLLDERSRLPARVDLVVPDLEAVTAIVEAGAHRNSAVHDSVVLSILANVLGIGGDIVAKFGVVRALGVDNLMALGALAAGWVRLGGGERPRSVLAQVANPTPERWGRRSIADVLQALRTTEAGLSSPEAAARQHAVTPRAQGPRLWTAILAQLRSPLIGLLAAGAGASLLFGAPIDALVIATTIVNNVAIGAWLDRRTNEGAEALRQLGAAGARVLRDGQSVTVPAREVVPGDVLLLAAGDRVAADARLLSSQGLEVDEAALTGESLPVPKAADGATDASRVVLEGSDVTVGLGRAVVVAVGQQTQMGATAAAALALEGAQQSPLDVRLGQLLRQVLPLSVVGGAIVALAGLLRSQALLPQLALGTSMVVAAVPEGLPLLARFGELAVGRRLADRQALVHHLGSVEALGRVDVACADKTGTMTAGHLALNVVADRSRESSELEDLPANLLQVVLTAALASPRPNGPQVAAHPTDVAVIRGAEEAGLGQMLQLERVAEAAFDPVQAFHAVIVDRRLVIKGAPEAILPRCRAARSEGRIEPLDGASREAWQARARQLAERGLRVLMVAEGPAETAVEDPQGLVALGFLGISDPLRVTVPAAVRRCQEAGVRVIMLTGDHPATARTIAREAGLLDGEQGLLTGAELVALDNGELDRRLEQASVIARATPLDKLRIIESLQRRGHTVAMTGDGVNDAPALRLADVGVAMGRGGTEVARQAADVVLGDDDFVTLVEALVEGRSFWRNLRRALGLLLGGNLGEIGLMMGGSLLGVAAPLIARQILAVNLITDVFPSITVALQEPAHRNLGELSREGATALEDPLRRDVVRRAVSTALPSLGAYLLALRAGVPQARSVAFTSSIATQLAQTLELGRTEEGWNRPVLAAVAGSTGILVAALTIPPLQQFLSLTLPGPAGWLLIGGASVVAVVLSQILKNYTIPSLTSRRAQPKQLFGPA